MTNTKSHSPLPWKDQGRVIFSESALIAKTETWYTDVKTGMANASLIVKAVNSHQPLESNLTWALDMIVKLSGRGGDMTENDVMQFNEARAILAKINSEQIL